MSCDKNKRKFEELEAENDELRLKLALPNVRQALLGERLMDVIGIVASGGGRRFGAPSGGPFSQGFAADVSHCLNLCKLTRVIVQRSDVADMLTQSLRLQCGAREARAAKREQFVFPSCEWGVDLNMVECTTQLMRAAILNNLPRVLQIIQLGAPLDLVDENGSSALHWACELGHEQVAKALLDGKYEGRGATVDLQCAKLNWTPLMTASVAGHEAVVRLLLSRGAKQELQSRDTGYTALHLAVDGNFPGVVALLCGAPGSAAAMELNGEGYTPLGLAIDLKYTGCESALRAAGATF